MKKLGSLRVRVLSPDDADKLFLFLDRQEYPFPWEEQYLKDCMMIRIGTPAETWGYWWFHWLDGCDFVMEAHVCISRKRYGQWATPFVLSRLFAIVDLVGAKTIIVRPPNAAAARTLGRLGFTKVGPVMTYDVQQEEDPYGRNV